MSHWISKARLRACLQWQEARRLCAPKLDDKSTPHDRLVHAAHTGQLETAVAKAKRAEPVAMTTPE